MKFTLSPLLLTATLLSLSTASTILTRSYSSTCSTCSPFPEENKCDITTSCIYVYGHEGSSPAPNYCACRHGYRGNYVKPGDTNSQFRLPWAGQEGRVFVKPGVVCDTLCDDWQLGKDGCKEVQEVEQCL